MNSTWYDRIRIFMINWDILDQFVRYFIYLSLTLWRLWHWDLYDLLLLFLRLEDIIEDMFYHILMMLHADWLLEVLSSLVFLQCARQGWKGPHTELSALLSFHSCNLWTSLLRFIVSCFHVFTMVLMI